MADGKAYTQFFDVPQTLFNTVAYVIPTSCKGYTHMYHLMNKDVIMSNISCMALAIPNLSQGHLHMVINWTPTTRFLPCQAQPGAAHEPWYPFTGKKPQEQHQGKGIEKSIPHSSMYERYAPSTPSTFKGSYPWLLTGQLLLNLYHASFSKDLHMGHGSPPANSG